MTTEQTLVGAMGCASWRSHYRLREHATLAGSVAGVIRGGAPLRIESADALDLNEVGITDAVLATIWRFGPRAAAYAVSSHAEARHLAADIAIVHEQTSRILLYQAKLASAHDGTFRLKSPVTTKQLALLRRQRPVEIQGIRYQVTGRLALYQQDLTPYLECCPPPCMPGIWPEPWRARPGWFSADGGGSWMPAPEIGRKYYETVLAQCRCSPSGVLAALVPGGCSRVTSLSSASTWPWEFETYQWLRRASPYNGRKPDANRGRGGAAPSFEPYLPTSVAPQSEGQPAEIASELAVKLRLPTTTQLHVITLP